MSCTRCRLHHLDGIGVAALVRELRPTHLFLDFDQTLCNSKSGYAPLVGKHSLNPHLSDFLLSTAACSSGSSSSSAATVADVEAGGNLAGCVASKHEIYGRPPYDTTHPASLPSPRAPANPAGEGDQVWQARTQVVTRNSNRDAIVSFLSSKGFNAHSYSGVSGEGVGGDAGSRGGAMDFREEMGRERMRRPEIGVRCVKLENTTKARVVLASLAAPQGLSPPFLLSSLSSRSLSLPCSHSPSLFLFRCPVR